MCLYVFALLNQRHIKRETSSSTSLRELVMRLQPRGLGPVAAGVLQCTVGLFGCVVVHCKTKSK